MDSKEEWKEKVMASRGVCILCEHSTLAHLVNEYVTGGTACCVMGCNCPELESGPHDSHV